MTYSQKLRDPRWQKKRLLILDRDAWKCCCCGSGAKNLQVHHLVYARLDPWEYSDECLQTLCDECHEARQELTDKIVTALRMSLRDVPTTRLETVAARLMASAMKEMA